MTVMPETLAAALPRHRARATGLVYLAYFLTVVTGAILTRGLVVPGDAAATAHNLLADAPRFRAGVAVGLLANVAYVALTALIYELLAPVDRALSRLAACCSLVGCAVQSVGCLFHLAPLVVLGRGPLGGVPVGAFSAEQWQALALALFDLRALAFNVGLVFFACCCLLLGYLVARSAFLPRALGVLLAAAGVGWLTVLGPPLTGAVPGAVQALGFVAELALMLWLVVRGVDVRRWADQAGAAAGPPVARAA